jgi:hypothetical protein
MKLHPKHVNTFFRTISFMMLFGIGLTIAASVYHAYVEKHSAGFCKCMEPTSTRVYDNNEYHQLRYNCARKYPLSKTIK